MRDSNNIFNNKCINLDHNNSDIPNASVNKDIKDEETVGNMSLTLLDKINEGII